MLRLVLLVLSLAAPFWTSTDTGGGWDPNGLTTPPPPSTDAGGGWDPNG
jgi:hypothetical protein